MTDPADPGDPSPVGPPAPDRLPAPDGSAGLPGPPPPAAGPSSRPLALWVGLALVAVGLAVVAVVVARSDGSSSGTASGAATTPSTAVTIGTEPGAEAQLPADALPPYDATDPHDAAAGLAAPTISGVGPDGTTRRVGPDGSPLVIVFLAHWCPHCQAELPRLVQHLADHPLPEGVELEAVLTALKPGAPNYPPEPWLAGEHWPSGSITDDASSTGAATYGLTSFPYFVAVDADGTVVERASGELSTDQFDSLVDAARSGHP